MAKHDMKEAAMAVGIGLGLGLAGTYGLTMVPQKDSSGQPLNPWIVPGVLAAGAIAATWVHEDLATGIAVLAGVAAMPPIVALVGGSTSSTTTASKSATAGVEVSDLKNTLADMIQTAVNAKMAGGGAPGNALPEASGVGARRTQGRPKPAAYGRQGARPWRV